MLDPAGYRCLSDVPAAPTSLTEFFEIKPLTNLAPPAGRGQSALRQQARPEYVTDRTFLVLAIFNNPIIEQRFANGPDDRRSHHAPIPASLLASAVTC